MFETALVALDLQPAGTTIVDCLPELQRSVRGRVILAHMIQVGYQQHSGYGREEDYRAWLEKLAQAFTQQRP